MDNEIKVSVFCNVYNHENYIREALDSFIMQKTSFAFEVLVHDDASTDHTADIIREYEKQYPGIIKPIYQKDNQYSRGVSITYMYQVPRAQGNYIAVCEGDDYWTDSYKLQKQFDEMEQRPEIDMCAHASSTLRGECICGRLSAGKEKTIFNTNDVITGGGGFFATNSLFYRKNMWLNIPDFYKYLGLDYSLQIWGSLRGGILFLPDDMSIYRLAVQNSWTDRMSKNPQIFMQHIEKANTMLRMVDDYTSGNYHEAILQHIADNSIKNLIIQNRYHDIIHGEFSVYYNAYPLKKKLAIQAKQFLHFIGIK